MGFFRKTLDVFILNDLEWKKKYCPTLYNYLSCNEKDRHKIFLQMGTNVNAQYFCKHCGKDFHPQMHIYSNVEISEAWEKARKHELICKEEHDSSYKK